MRSPTRGLTALLVVLVTAGIACAQGDLGPSLLANGDFESGEELWWHPQDAYAGKLETALRHGGLNCWRMDLQEPEREAIMSRAATIERGRDLHVSAWIRCADVAPADAISLRLQQFHRGKPAGWHLRNGRNDLIHTGGSHDWFRFAVNVADADLDAETTSLVLYLRAAPGSTGTVWFDDASVQTVVGRAPGESLDRQAAPPLDLSREAPARDDAAAFRDIPFLDRVGEGVEIDCGSDHNLFYGEAPAVVTITMQPVDGAVMEWLVSDYWGRKVDGGTAAETVRVQIPRMGYFEVAARLTRDGQQLGAARTSLSHLPEPPLAQTSPEWILGSWVQQNDLLAHLGARWTRVGTGWQWLEPEQGKPNEALWESMDRHVASMVEQGITPVFLFSKVPSWAGPHYKRVGPDHWDDFRAYVRKCVTRYRDQVDIWEVMNEPYIPTLFPGPIEEVMQWHRVVREEVDRGDPGGLVIGPCLDTRSDYLFDETRDLLDLGLAKLITGVSVHTYGGLEAAGYLRDFDKLRDLLRAYDADGPIYITEQGLSVPEDLPMERLQAQYLVRMVLLCLQARVKAVIWHMMSWPQGPSDHERDFAIVRARDKMPQRAPRPAFTAAAVLSSVLGKARFVGTLDDLGETVAAQVYQAAGEPILALWDWGRPEHEVEVQVGTPEVTVVDLMGVRSRARTDGGRLKLTLTPNPVYVLGGAAGTLLQAP